MTAEPARRRLRAPGEHGEALLDPPLQHVGELICSTQRIFANRQSDWTRWIAGVREAAQHFLVDLARKHSERTSGISDDRALPANAPIILAGHQPTLFHAGVWFKNFLLSSLGSLHQAHAINLIVDNDTISDASIRVPVGPEEVASIMLDAPTEAIPFEERPVRDGSSFSSFGHRVAKAISNSIDNPLVRDLWSCAHEVRARVNPFAQNVRLGIVLAGARHALERQWGLRTTEVPLSEVCDRKIFGRFAFRLLDDLAAFRQVYNQSLLEYRTANRIRSRSHPVPELVEENGWIEAPFWIWTTEEPRRKRLFVQRSQGGLELTDRDTTRFTLPKSEDGAAQSWPELGQRGIKIRPRALLTTMYARLVLCDLFIHGIGGAMYDELTDAIIRRYFGIEPPPYLTATATVQLPLEYPRVTQRQVCEAQHDARQLRFSAERYLRDGRSTELVQQKQQLLRDIPPPGEKKTWHSAMMKVNEELLPLVAAEQQRLNERAAQLAEQHRVSRLLGSREFSFCLYPADFLRPLLLDLSRARP